MVVNNQALKRWSTWANFVSMMVSAALLYVPDLGLEAVTVAKIMLTGNVIVAACQAVKQANL